jgi:hypothetical protein
VEPQQGALRVFEGTYSEYRAAAQAETAGRTITPVEAAPRPAAPRSRQQPNPGLTNQERKRQRQVQEIEAKIAEGEAQLAAIGRQLENPPADLARVQHLGQEYNRIQQVLDGLFQEWERLNTTFMPG